MKILSPEQLEFYSRCGYLIVPGFLSDTEVQKLYAIALEDDAIRKHAFDLNDQEGKRTRLSLWYTPGDDAYGLFTRGRSLHGMVHQLMGGDGEVCHFHSKLMQKEPKVGGAWEWHQDYGYWYKNEFLFPDAMMSVMLAITPATRENGCLQVISGSHRMGRVEHGFAGEQVGAAPRMVELALKTMPLVYAELNAGDLLFFHSNLLHRSEANLSNHARWSLISCYNRSANVPYNEPNGSSTVPLDPVDDDALLQGTLSGLSENAGFLAREQDEALK